MTVGKQNCQIIYLMNILQLNNFDLIFVIINYAPRCVGSFMYLTNALFLYIFIIIGTNTITKCQFYALKNKYTTYFVCFVCGMCLVKLNFKEAIHSKTSTTLDLFHICLFIIIYLKEKLIFQTKMDENNHRVMIQIKSFSR